MSYKPRSTLQFRNNVHERARQGQPLSNEEIEQITRETVELAGEDPSSVSTQSQNPLQAQWAASTDRVLHKPANQISQGDAKELHNVEMRAFENLPAQGSVASHVQSQADHNERT